MEQEGNREIELYFHIPFCVRKCLYCDFLSAPAESKVRENYGKALLAEVRGRADEYRTCRVSSVFIGGGTPSLAKTAWIRELLETVRKCFCVSADAEITMEVNPGTADGESLRAYFDAGVNRLSIGLQSAWDEELRALGRVHDFRQFLETYDGAVKAGFTNINVDLMYGLPGQTLASCMGTIERVLALRPRPVHVSLYSLIVEERTPFFALQKQGKLKLPDEDLEWRMGVEAGKRLHKAGYLRYEISNYAVEGYECRHNCGYWRRTDYIGFGLGAASLFQNVRFSNKRDLEAYLADPLECRECVEKLTEAAQMEEFLFLGLRMLRGVSVQKFEQEFGVSIEEVYGEVLRKNCAQGLLCERKDASGERFFALTERGLEVANHVMSQFLFD
ncbi:MAG: radical SAM family heme chaperone HemW [Candidatus Gastranaerophilales bacterium]|nr:radical SAM family heme chaperone HemW [Candidatus Gastranaerophilales bacterium]